MSYRTPANRRRRPATMTAAQYQSTALESGMEETLRELVAYKHGRLWHVRRSDTAPETEDMPDLLILIPGRVLVVETKSQQRAMTRGQAEVAALMQTVTAQTCAVVRPEPKPGELSFNDLLAVIADTTC